MTKTLLSIRMETITMDQARELIASGRKLTPASLYEPEHAPKGTRFVMVLSASGKNRSPYRVR